MFCVSFKFVNTDILYYHLLSPIGASTRVPVREDHYPPGPKHLQKLRTLVKTIVKLD